MSEDKPQVVMPVWSPPLGQGPHPMERAEMMIIECEANRGELERITPSLCEPADTNIIQIFFANNRQPPNSILFNEMGVMQQIRYKGEAARTMPYLFVSDDKALLGGRELFGMPKLLMDDNPLQIYGNQIFARVARKGVTIIEGSMVLERKAEPSELPFSEAPSLYERHIPNPNPSKPSLKQLIKLEVTDRQILGNCWFGRGHIQMFHPLGSGLDKLNLKPTGRAWYGAFSWNLPHGDIIETAEV